MVSTHLHYSTAICQKRLRHHKKSRLGWLVTHLLYKHGARKLQVRNTTTCVSCLVDMRQVFGTCKVLFAFLALHLRSVASLMSHPCSWMLLEYYKLKDIIHLDCVGKEDTLTLHKHSILLQLTYESLNLWVCINHLITSISLVQRNDTRIRQEVTLK
jgi:hypothetical protein